MRQPTSARTFDMSIPTDLSATLATLSNTDPSPTFPSFMRMQASFFADDIFDSPLLLNTQGQLENDFQSNSRVTHISRPAFSYPALNGLGIHTSQSLFKDEDITDQQVVPPAGAMALPASPSSGDSEPSFHAVPMLPPDQEGLDDDPFNEVYKLLNSIDATVGYCTGGGSTLPYFDSDCPESWLISPESEDAARSAGEDTTEISFPTSHSGLAGHSSSESAGDYDLVPRSNSPILGPFPDINMFDLAYMNRIPDAGINPADIMRPLSPASSVAKRSASPPNSSFDDNSSTSSDQLPSAEVLNSIVAMLSDTTKNENVPPQAAVLPASRPTMDKRGVFHPKRRIVNEFGVRMGASKQKMSPCTADEPFAYQFPTPTAAAHRSPLLALPFQSNQQAAFTSVLDCGSHDATEDTPVLNAHLGIDLTELVDRADKYRARFPGRAIDKKWLMAYAGKLTKRGELLEDYRCYVNGCTQKNKRRDHILVHVGSHVDQRLFVCSVWCVNSRRANKEWC